MKMKRTILSFTILVVLQTLVFSSEPKTRGFLDKNGKWGIIDENLKVIIPAKYEYADEFTGKYANVKFGEDDWGLIDKNQNVILRMKARRLESYNEGWCAYTDTTGTRGESGLVNEKGEKLKFGGFTRSFSEGLAAVQKNEKGKFVFIDSAGKEAFGGAEFDFAESFYDGYANVGINGRYGVIDRKGNFVLPCEYRSVYYSGCDYWSVIKLNDEYNEFLVDKSNKILSPEGIRRHSSVFGDYCFVSLDGDIIQQCRKFIIKTQEIGEISDTIVNRSTRGKVLAVMKKDSYGKWYCALEDINGNQVCPVLFTSFLDEVNDILRLEKDGVEYYVNQKGQFFSPK